MSLLQYSRKLFSLEILDLRLTNPSKARIQDPATKDGGSRPSSSPPGTYPPLWRTPEFYFYYVAFIIVVPQMFKAVLDISNRKSVAAIWRSSAHSSIASHPNYSNYEHLLSPGWIPGRKVDNSDSQYAGFRDNLPYMLALIIVHPIARKAYEFLFPIANHTNESTSMGVQAANARLEQRTTFDLFFGLVFIVTLYGFSVFKILLILYINFSLAKKLPRNIVVPATWVFGVGILFANELCAGYPYQSIINLLLHGHPVGKENWGTFLDGHSGLLGRWEILFNFTVLRLISFNMDYYWSAGRPASSILEKKQLDPSDLSERERVDFPAQHKDYSFSKYLAYLFYSPLHLGGPIITFNDFISQAKYTPKSVETTRTVLYGIRFLIGLLTMEVVLHFIYAVAIAKAKPAWEVYDPFQLSMLGYFNLHIIWLKLLLPWRFFRLWSLIDGIDPPENMVRCMSNNYSALAFWRGWHRSFNRWILRYIYIPLGGSGKPGAEDSMSTLRKIANFLAVFTFVALWHDINLRLLMWGWLVTLFVLPEALAVLAFPRKKWQSRQTAFRIICGIGAIGNMLMMMAANLVGFAIGLDGLRGMVHGIVGSYSGMVFFVAACACLFIGNQVMFEIREEEYRNGIRMNC